MTPKEFRKNKGIHYALYTIEQMDNYLEEYARQATFIKDDVIYFQEALITLYETEKEGSLKFNLFRDSYKSTIEKLKNKNCQLQ